MSHRLPRVEGIAYFLCLVNHSDIPSFGRLRAHARDEQVKQNEITRCPKNQARFPSETPRRYETINALLNLCTEPLFNFFKHVNATKHLVCCTLRILPNQVKGLKTCQKLLFEAKMQENKCTYKA